MNIGAQWIEYDGLGDAAVKRMHALTKELKKAKSDLVHDLPVLPIDHWYGQKANKYSMRWAEKFLTNAGKRKIGFIKKDFTSFKPVLSKSKP